MCCSPRCQSNPCLSPITDVQWWWATALAYLIETCMMMHAYASPCLSVSLFHALIINFFNYRNILLDLEGYIIYWHMLLKQSGNKFSRRKVQDNSTPEIKVKDYHGYNSAMHFQAELHHLEQLCTIKQSNWRGYYFPVSNLSEPGTPWLKQTQSESKVLVFPNFKCISNLLS